MKPILYLSLFFVILNTSTAQTIERYHTSTAGALTAGSGITLDWSLGEAFITMFPTEEGTIKEGFLQPGISVLQDSEETIELNVRNDGIGLHAIIYPNPFSEQYTFHLTEPLDYDLQLTLLDYTGRSLAKEVLSNGEQQINWNVSSYSPGLYLLQVADKHGMNYQVFKLVKH